MYLKTIIIAVNIGVFLVVQSIWFLRVPEGFIAKRILKRIGNLAGKSVWSSENSFRGHRIHWLSIIKFSPIMTESTMLPKWLSGFYGLQMKVYSKLSQYTVSSEHLFLFISNNMLKLKESYHFTRFEYLWVWSMECKKPNNLGLESLSFLIFIHSSSSKLQKYLFTIHSYILGHFARWKFLFGMLKKKPC